MQKKHLFIIGMVLAAGTLLAQEPQEPLPPKKRVSHEQMTQMNEGLSKCMNYMSSIYNDMTANSEITQTLSLIGKDVTVKDPDDPSGTRKISGRVSEASFEDGEGKIKIDGKFYSIANILTVKDSSIQ